MQLIHRTVYISIRLKLTSHTLWAEGRSVFSEQELLLFRHGIRELEALQQPYSRVGSKFNFLASVSKGGTAAYHFC